jgi:hypothetical protein
MNPNVIAQTPHAINLLATNDVKHISVDFNSTAWAYCNCKMIYDTPYTVKTLQLGAESYMYAILKFSPGLYLCRVISNCPDDNHVANCRLEMLERHITPHGDDDAEPLPVARRHGCLCRKQADLSLLLTTDTNVECRIVFENRVDIRIPTFRNMEVRSKQQVVMPLRLTSPPTGMNQHKHTIQYRAPDVHFVLKKTLYAMHWLSSLEKDLDGLIQLVTNPLWDMSDPRSEHDYRELTQSIQQALVEHIPVTFISSSFRYKVHMFPGVRFPLISQTLVTEIFRCFKQTDLKVDDMACMLRQSLKYVNFLLIDFTEFKSHLSTKLTSMNPAEVGSSAITITV